MYSLAIHPSFVHIFTIPLSLRTQFGMICMEINNKWFLIIFSLVSKVIYTSYNFNFSLFIVCILQWKLITIAHNRIVYISIKFHYPKLILRTLTHFRLLPHRIANLFHYISSLFCNNTLIPWWIMSGNEKIVKNG